MDESTEGIVSTPEQRFGVAVGDLVAAVIGLNGALRQDPISTNDAERIGDLVRSSAQRIETAASEALIALKDSLSTGDFVG